MTDANRESATLLDGEFLRRLERLELRIRTMTAGEMRGDVVTRRRGQSSLFRDHSRYTQGDDLRFVDWNVYSRSGELFVKLFDAEESPRLLLLVDSTGSMDFGRSNKFFFARRLAAALGFIGLSRTAVVDLAMLGGSTEGRARSSHFGRRRIHGLMQRLNDVVASGDVDFFEAIRAAAGKKKGRGVAVVVSDFFTESGYARGLSYLVHLGFKVVAAHVLDVEDFRPRLTGPLELIDLETKNRLRGTLDPELLSLFADEVGAWTTAVEHFCLANEVTYCRIDTGDSLDETVVRLLVEKGVLR